jgi:casein kinase II subunit beta
MSRRQDLRRRFLDRSPTSWFVEIDDYYLQSSVSYYDLNRRVRHCTRAADVIKGRQFDLSGVSQEQINSLGNSTRLLYGLLHQRFIVTEDGVRKMSAKISTGLYGTCPRLACKTSRLLPMGFSIEPNEGKVKLWCPKCHDIYDSGKDLDGAFFGPDFPVMYHKIMGIPLRFQPKSNALEGWTKPDGTTVPAIPQKLYRWGEAEGSRDATTKP